MKKLSVLLSVVLALALAVPAFAAVTPEWKLEGEANFGLLYAQNPEDPDAGYQLTGNVHKLWTKLTLAGVNRGNNPKAAFSFGVVAERNEENKLQDDKDPNFGNGAFNNSNAGLNLRITNVVFTLNGAYWKNGPEVTTQIGNLKAFKSDYVAGEKDTSDAAATAVNAKSAQGDGITIAGLTAGPFDTYFAYLFHGSNSEDRLAVTSLSGNLDALDVSLTAASHYNTESVLVHDLHLGLGVEPADGVSVKANYATDGLNNGYVYDVNGTLDTIPGVTLTAGVRGIDQDGAWNPRFAKRDDDLGACKDQIGDLCAHDSKNGFNVGVSTTQAGIDLGLTYKTGESPAAADDDEKVTTLSAGTKVSDFDLSGKVTLTDKVVDAQDKTKFEATVKKAFGGINTSYSFSTEKATGDDEPRVIHTVAANTTIDTPFADNVKVSGQLKLDSNQFLDEAGNAKAQIHTSAEWTAPNGLKLGLHYANYNRKDHGPIPNASNPDSSKPLKAEGFYVTAEYGLKF